MSEQIKPASSGKLNLPPVPSNLLRFRVTRHSVWTVKEGQAVTHGYVYAKSAQAAAVLLGGVVAQSCPGWARVVLNEGREECQLRW